MAPEEDVVLLLKSLEKTSYTKLARFEALDMLCKLSREKFRYKVLLPFMDGIFKPKDDQEAFTNFLHMCFDDVTVVEINEAGELCKNNTFEFHIKRYGRKPRLWISAICKRL